MVSDAAHDLDHEPDLDGEPDLDDLDGPWSPPPAPGPRPRRRTTAALLLAGAAVLSVGVVVVASVLRSPQERLETRVGEALEAAGVQLAAPVSLETGDGPLPLWTGRLEVVADDGTTSVVRFALRLDEGAGPGGADGAAQEPRGAPAAPSLQGLLPLVDCDSRFPLAWPGDSDTSFRTTRSDLAECVTRTRGDGVLVTVAWADDDPAGGYVDGAAEEAAGGAGRPPADRQTWLTDGRGGLVWMHDGGGGAGGAPATTGEQQRAVATAQGLLAAL